MSETDALLATKEVRIKLAEWYRRWGIKGLTPPEVMEDDEVVDHATELGLVLSESTQSTRAELKKLRVSPWRTNQRRCHISLPEEVVLASFCNQQSRLRLPIAVVVYGCGRSQVFPAWGPQSWGHRGPKGSSQLPGAQGAHIVSRSLWFIKC